MCTAATYLTDDFYFGRTLDNDVSYGEEIVVMPRAYPLAFRRVPALPSHYAVIGTAHVSDGFPLFYDAVNEHGLGMAGLNFVDSAVYGPPAEGRDNVASFEFIPWILGQCASVAQARELLGRVNLTGDAFRPELPPARLHWIIADRHEAIVVESVAEGVMIYDDPAGVLTNEPPFPQQLFQLNNYLSLSPDPPVNRFSDALELKCYSRGMGALGLPGDVSSQSRFVRAAFTRLNSISGPSEAESVSQFFHILGAVEQVRGCCRLEGGKYELTIYTSCCNATRGIYYYTTYENRQISAVELRRCDLDASGLFRYPMLSRGQIAGQN